MYWKIYAALMLLLAATVGAAYLPLGPFGIVVTLAIAIAKALLVILFFMHVRYNPKLIWLYSMIGFLWLACLIGGVMADVVTRH